jgi:predicted RNase H-like HicB family nuclease
MRGYIGLIHKERDSEYGVSFPDFPGCVTAGASLEEARAMAQEALTLHVRGMLEDGDELPAASSLDEIHKDRANKDSIAVLTVVPAQQAKSVRVNVTFPEDALEAIDRYAERRGYTRSGFLAVAARRAIAEKV